MPDGDWSGRAPGRVNLVGEHVDYAGGLVLPAAVDRFTVVTGRYADDWSVSSEVPGGEPYLRALGRRLGAPPQAVEVTSTVPSGAGMSSSAALLVAIAAGLRPALSGREAALVCRDAEEEATGVRVGVMDQFACALGRAGHALLLDCSTLEYELVPFPPSVVIAVLDSGVHRRLEATPYNRRRAELEAGEPRRVRHFESEVERVRRFAAAMRSGDELEMGALVSESHRSLRDDFEVSTPEVDAIVEAAAAAPGCLGARVMGAGFGGSILALVRAELAASFAGASPRPALVCTPADGAFAA